MNFSEPPWLAAARRGDAAAFRHLVDAHARPLYHVCQRLLGDARWAEDALQEALIQAWRALDQFDGRASLHSWLHRIAVNAALAMLRTQAFQQQRQALDLEAHAADLPAETGLPADWLDTRQQQERLSRALTHLSALERAAFVLRHVEQHSLLEVAAQLDSNVNAIKQAVFRAVRKLRAALGVHEESYA